MEPTHQTERVRRPQSPVRRGLGPLPGAAIRAVICLGMLAAQAFAGDPSFTEYQVKALFLFNFAKYVEWPSEAFVHTNSPITIAVLGENNFGDDLARAVKGRRANGRPVLIREISTVEEAAQCHILFISASEKKRVEQILSRIRSLPVLSVSEMEQFTQQGGTINFVKKDGKVRLEIDLAAAREAKLRLSAKLLAVADVVKGKQ